MGVQVVDRWILARLRNRIFFSLVELNGAIMRLLEELKNRPMQHLGKPCKQLFEELDQPCNCIHYSLAGSSASQIMLELSST